MAEKVTPGYAETLEYIHGINRYAKKLGLENIRRLMRELGDPQDGLRFIHIAGTNGKGSTAAMAASVMRAAGYRTGLYTSPYLQRFTERIRVDDAEIPEGVLVGLAGEVRAAIDAVMAKGGQHPTELEVVAAIAFLYFARSGCDVVAFEVGLGGRYDPTNVIKTPLAAVIATIDYDHVSRLGGTLEKIAYEKAGIIKPGGDVVLYPQPDGVRRVFEAEAEATGARLAVCDFSSLRTESYGAGGQTFSYGRREGLEISLIGEFQTRNAALVVETIDTINRNAGCGIYVPEDALRRGLRQARWPGRMEILNGDPPFLIDAAHNAQCARALRDTLEKFFPGREKILIVGVVRDKDYMSILDATVPLASAAFTVTTESARALGADELAQAVRERGGARLAGHVWACASPAEAAERALALAREAGAGGEIGGGVKSDGGGGSGSLSDAGVGGGGYQCGGAGGGEGSGPVICAFGSLYYIGKLRDYFGYR